MSKEINIQPQAVAFGAVKNLLNGAFTSLDGPIGFVASQPRILVTGINVTNPSNSSAVEFALFKGLSGGSDQGTQVVHAVIKESETIAYPAGFVLDASDFLTANCISNGTIVITINAEVEP